MANIANLEILSKIFSNPSWDLLVIFFFIAAGFFYGISAGRMKLAAALFSFYISAFISENFYYLDSFLKDRALLEIFALRGLVFLVLAALIAVLFNRIMPREEISGTKVWWQVFLLSILAAGFLASFVFRILPAKNLFDFSPIVKEIFASANAFFWWLILPLITLFVIVRKR